MNVRHERVSSTIRKEISTIIQNEVKNPKIGFITVTDVEVTNDYSFATIYVRFLGSNDRQRAGLEALERSSGFIRSELGKRIKIFKIPALIFKIDTSIDEGNKIEKIIKEIHKED